MIKLNIQKTATWTPAQWYNSEKHQASYKRIYKSASSTVVDLLEDHKQEAAPKYSRLFSVIREPYARSRSIYKEISGRGQLRLRPAKNYNEYLKYTLENGYFDKHQFPQAFWLQGLEDIKLFSTENLDQLALWLGAKPTKVKHINKRLKDIHETKQDREIVRHLYAADFEIWDKYIINHAGH